MKPVASCRLVLATAIACLLSTAGQAQAKVIAYSSLQIINVTVVSGAEVLDLSSLNGVNITAGNVSLRGTSASDAFPMNDGDSDVPLVCIGDCAGIAQNDFSSVAMANPGRDFARADASLSGSIVRPLGFDNRTVAEAQLLTAGTASAEGVGQSILNMTTIDFTSGQSGELALTFEALGELSVHSDEAVGAAMADFDLDIRSST